MAKWMKWNIRVQHEVVFLRLSLLWGFSEHVLYLDTIRCYFASLSIDICAFFTRYSLTYLSLKLYIHPSKCCYRTKCMYGIRYCSEIMFVLARGTTAILLWAKLLGCEKLNKRGFKLLKARANGRNILGQQEATLLGPACCERLHTMLCVVATCWKLSDEVWF